MWLEGLATNLLDDPAVEGVVINARDVTERRIRMERQAALSDLGLDVLRATTLAAAVKLGHRRPSPPSSTPAAARSPSILEPVARGQRPGGARRWTGGRR